MIPSVRRARPPSVAARCTSGSCVLPEALQEDVEILDGSLVVRSSHESYTIDGRPCYVFGSAMGEGYLGMLKSAAAAGGHGGTMALIVSALQLGA